ncbi:cytochrome P450 [Streptomyces sp. JNUCC 64]
MTADPDGPISPFSPLDPLAPTSLVDPVDPTSRTALATGATGTGRAARADRAHRAARRRDRRVYTRSHPVLFALLAVTRRRPVTRLGGTLLVQGEDAYRRALTRVPLDRAAAGTTGGAVRELAGGGSPFDQEGTEHRAGRRAVGEGLGAAGVERLRPVWREVLAERLAPLGGGGAVDLVETARALAGATVCALLESPADPRAVARAAAEVAAAAVRDGLPGLRSGRAAREAAGAAARLEALLHPEGPRADGARRAVLAVAGITTTVAALPRAAAWCADAGLWERAADDLTRPALVGELLRVLAPSPVLPRVAAADAVLDGRPVRAGDRLLLVARHAAGAHTDPPDARCPAPPAVARLVFGAGPHACPGARLAVAQLDDVLAALAVHRPVVVRARVDRRAALPGWRSLTVRAGREGAR